jgi:hypothetical protein
MNEARIFEVYSLEFVKNSANLIGVKVGEKTCAPAVTRRKDIGQMTVRPISFQREKRDSRDPTGSILRPRRLDLARGKRPSET